MRVLRAMVSSDRGNARRGACGLLAALAPAIALLLPPTALAGEAPVTVKPAEVATALFVAGDIARLSKVPGGTEDVVLEKALQQLYADEPTLSPTSAEGYVGDMKALLAAPSSPSPASLELMAGNQRIVAILAALERPYGSPAVELPPAAKLAVTHLAAVALSDSSDIFADAENPKYFEPLADARTNLSYTTFAPATVLRATRELAAGNRLFGQARDALWKSAGEESVFSEWKELLGESKALDREALKGLREAIEAGDGTLTDTPTQLTDLFSAGQKATQEQACEHGGAGEEAIGGESIGGVPRLKCSGGALYEDAHVARSCPEKAKCEAELEHLQTQAQEQAKAIAEQRAAMTAAGELLRPSDNTAAALQQATTQAQAQITEEETAYATYEAEKAQKEAIAGGVKSGLLGGTAVLALATGNYSEGIAGLIGVGFELYEHTEEGLSNPPPGPQEITLQDLADLSTQLAGFQQYTQEAFHAINTQLAQLTSQMARENYELKEELSALGARLQKEQGTIFALQDQVKELFAAQTKADLQTTIEDSVGWLRRTGEPLAGAKIQEALVALKKYATEIANGALVNNSETQPFTFEGADHQLTGKTTGEPAELSEDITYLGRFPVEAGWSVLAPPPSLANTTFWSESARAYAQLLLENSGHATGPDVAGLKALEKEGVTLEKAQGAWSEASGGGKTGNAILDQALSHFEAAAAGGGVDRTGSIQTLLEEAAEKYLSHNLITGSPSGGNPTGAKLWGGAEQSFSAGAVAAAKYPALKWEECSGSNASNGKQEMPEAFIATLPRAFVDGVRLGVIGAPGSGDPLIFKACRTIAKTNSVASTKNAEHREGCPHLLSETCEIVYQAEAKQEKEAETAGETLTLQEGEGGHQLASVTAGECNQTALFWKGAAHSESEDPEDSELDGDVYGYSAIGPPFEERHVGSIASLHYEGTDLHWEYFSSPFEGTACPYLVEGGGEDKAGVEYADYNSGAAPLGGVEPTLVKDVDAKLAELQEGAYDEGYKALTNPPTGDPLASLAGARALVQSYVKLGFPQALASDTALDSDVEGFGAQFLAPQPESPPEPLPGQVTSLIGSWVKRVKNAGETELKTLLGENLIGEVAHRASAWVSELVTQLKPYVEGKVEGLTPGASEAVSEQSALVEATLNRLQLTRDVLAEARAPSAETLAPSDVGVAEATVRGEVDANGGVVESCVFEYGASEYYGHTTPCSAAPGATEKAAVVSAKIADWTPEGSFHERVVMKTWGGTTYGEDVKVQLAQSTQAPSGLVIAQTDTQGATIGAFKAEELPATVTLPPGLTPLVGSLKFTVNVTPGGSARVKIELPAGSAPSALYKLVHTAGGEEYKEIPASLYTIAGNTIELTLVDGGPDDEDGEVNGVIVDPLVPVAGTAQPPATVTPATSPTAPTATVTSSTPATPAPKAKPPAHKSAPRECVSRREVTVHVSSHVTPPPGTKVVRSKILLRGRVVASLSGPNEVAVVVFAGAPKGTYEVTLVATLSNGGTQRKTLVFHTCIGAKTAGKLSGPAPRRAAPS
jgi:hypothetical protein